MKKYKHFFKTNLFLTLFLSGIFLTSCNNSVREYFEYYTDSAAIELMNLENVNGTSPSGFKSIDSNYDGNAEFILRNPKKYTLEMNFYATGKFEEALTLTSYYDPNDNWTVTQNASDPNIAQLWINKNLLNYIDNGNLKDSSENIIKAITGEITIEDSETHRPFESYDVNILVNSPPPYVKQAMVQIDTVENKYVICFYIPKFSGTVHACDTHKLIIAGKTYYFKDDSFEFYEKPDYSGSSSSDFSLTAPSELTSAVDSGPDFSSGQVPENCVAVYYRAGEISTGTVNYDIILEDDFGFKSITTVSNTAEKLNPVNIQDYNSTAAALSAEEDGYVYITLFQDGKTVNGNNVSGVTIDYKVERIKYGYGEKRIYTYGTATDRVTIKLPASVDYVYAIKATAKKSRYVESDEKTFGEYDVLRSPVYYVSQNGKSPENGALGTKASPFRTIQQAVNDITTQANNFGEVTGGYTINLLSNITPDESDTFMNGNHSALVCITNSYKYTINGNGHTIDAKRDDTKKGRVIYVGGSTSITIENAILTGGNINGHGGAIYFSSHEKLILKNVEIKNNKARYGAGIQLDTACDFISGSIHDNEATSGVAVYIENIGTLSLGDNSNISSIVNIYNNYNNNKETGSICVYGALTINQAKIFDNFIKASVSNPDIPNNVYLQPGRTINVGGNLSGCTIGVTTADSPSSGNTIQITNGYSTYNEGVPPARIFKSDAGYGAIMDESTGETVLAVGGGIIDVPSQIYDKVKIKLSKMSFYVKDTNKKINISATLDSDDIELSNVTSELYCYGEKVATYTGTEITLSSSYPADKYQLNVKAKYKGLDYSASFNISIFNKDDLTNLTSAPTSGTFKLSTPESLVKISEWVESGSNLSGVTIKLDDDIVLPDNFTSIGAGEETPDVLNTFHGVFDGNGKTIHVNSVAPGCKSVFGTLYANYEAGHAIIRNLTIEGDIVTTGDFFVFAEYTNTEAIIENCVNKCNVTTTGRVAGFTSEVNNGSKVINCRNEGTLISTGGCAAGITISDGGSDCMIYNSSNSGKIISGDVDDNGASAGGICCTNFASIINCYNTGDIQGVGFTGGITGFSYGARGVSNCYNAGRISSNKESAGGIIGSASNLTSSYKSTTMKNCCNYGVVFCSDSSGALIGKLPSTCTLTCTSGFYMSGTSSCGIADTDDSTYAVTSYSNESNAVSSLNEWCTSNTSVNEITLKQWKVGVSNNPVFVE